LILKSKSEDENNRLCRIRAFSQIKEERPE
jgi:hypothetical protein